MQLLSGYNRHIMINTISCLPVNVIILIFLVIRMSEKASNQCKTNKLIICIFLYKYTQVKIIIIQILDTQSQNSINSIFMPLVYHNII